MQLSSKSSALLRCKKGTAFPSGPGLVPSSQVSHLVLLHICEDLVHGFCEVTRVARLDVLEIAGVFLARLCVIIVVTVRGISHSRRGGGNVLFPEHSDCVAEARPLLVDEVHVGVRSVLREPFAGGGDLCADARLIFLGHLRGHLLVTCELILLVHHVRFELVVCHGAFLGGGVLLSVLLRVLGHAFDVLLGELDVARDRDLRLCG
mmetsp:Transcript_2789/g.8017  ORF Transcript_2789/g.8017 Transcript_2789/m.8017 type:complete len:206 (+) Transcript_2789:88-705(+)